MAFLNRARKSRAGLSSVLLGAAAASFLGCALLQGGGGDEEQGLAFSHRVHVEDQGLECLDCHAGVEDSDDPGMPLLPQCQLCHDGLDEEKPPEERVETLFDEEGRFLARRASALDEEVRFSHVQHVGAMQCADCHRGIEQSERIGPEPALDMDGCMACHQERGLSQDCAVCHTRIDQSWAPPSHELGWEKLHGPAARADLRTQVGRCELCHQESTCIDCHRVEAPDDHNQLWRRRTHGISASVDRNRCLACHRTDYCDRCHRDTLPVSHVGSFGSPVNRHCLGCHFPLQNEGCFVCHKSAPSHLTATPLPPDHSPGLNCRQCHGLTAPLPHVDNGDECILCHL